MTEVEVRGLVLTGETCLRLGRCSDALKTFQKAGVEMPRDALIACGEKAMQRRWFDDAREAFAAAGHKDGLIACGNKALEHGWLEDARLAFKAAAAIELGQATK